jgi:hypothetical protein
MTTKSLRLALESWLSTLPAQIKVLLEPHSVPPALLDLRVLLPELPDDSSGLALQLTHDDAHFSAWLPASGQGGSYYVYTEGDDEFSHCNLPAFDNEQGAVAALSLRVQDYLLASLDTAAPIAVDAPSSTIPTTAA